MDINEKLKRVQFVEHVMSRGKMITNFCKANMKRLTEIKCASEDFSRIVKYGQKVFLWVHDLNAPRFTDKFINYKI